jgi:hypothetical protein
MNKRTLLLSTKVQLGVEERSDDDLPPLGESSDDDQD